MTKQARMKLYLLVIAVLVIALLLRPESDAQGGDATVIVEAVARSTAAQQLPRVHGRASAIPAMLFVTDEPVVAAPLVAMPEPVVEAPAPARPEITILGWMHSGATPHVFVEWKGENHALSPSQELDDTYRFEGIDQGMAEFTYLPEGTVRMYRVGDLGSAD